MSWSTSSPDGANALAYDDDTVRQMDPLTCDLSLPGWDESYTKDELRSLIEQYKAMGEEQLWENLRVFLQAVIPVAEEAGVKMAIHPDDPPWGMFGPARALSPMSAIWTVSCTWWIARPTA